MSDDWLNHCTVLADTVLCKISNLKIPVTYPSTAPEIAIPELDGKTAKMFRSVIN